MPNLSSTEGKCQSCINVNKCQQNEGSDYAPYQYKLEDNTQSNIILPSADPCLFELRYPQKDIVGTAVQ